MRPFPLLSLFVIPVFLLTGCTAPATEMQPTQGTQTPSYPIPTATETTAPSLTLTPAITNIETPAPTVTAKLPTPTPTFTATPTNIDTLEPAQAMETIQPLIKDPMNCKVPCFWGIIPGKTRMDEAATLFSRLGFTPFEGTEVYSGNIFYTIEGYDTSIGRDSSVTLFYTDYGLVKNIIVQPEITKQQEGSPREWIAYSPETLIEKFGSPSDVTFAVSWMQRIGIDMIMYFDTSDLIVHYSGVGMDPKLFCPLSDPFDFMRLYIGPNPPDPPSFGAVSLKMATSLTVDQFSQLMLGDPQKLVLP